MGAHVFIYEMRKTEDNGPVAEFRGLNINSVVRQVRNALNISDCKLVKRDKTDTWDVVSQIAPNLSLYIIKVGNII